MIGLHVFQELSLFNYIITHFNYIITLFSELCKYLQSRIDYTEVTVIYYCVKHSKITIN